MYSKRYGHSDGPDKESEAQEAKKPKTMCVIFLIAFLQFSCHLFVNFVCLGTVVIRRYIAWYDFGLLCLQKPCMISGSFVIRKCVAWYDFRILCDKNVYCLV